MIGCTCNKAKDKPKCKAWSETEWPVRVIGVQTGNRGRLPKLGKRGQWRGKREGGVHKIAQAFRSLPPFLGERVLL